MIDEFDNKRCNLIEISDEIMLEISPSYKNYLDGEVDIFGYQFEFQYNTIELKKLLIFVVGILLFFSFFSKLIAFRLNFINFIFVFSIVSYFIKFS